MLGAEKRTGAGQRISRPSALLLSDHPAQGAGPLVSLDPGEHETSCLRCVRCVLDDLPAVEAAGVEGGSLVAGSRAAEEQQGLRDGEVAVVGREPTISSGERRRGIAASAFSRAPPARPSPRRGSRRRRLEDPVRRSVQLLRRRRRRSGRSSSRREDPPAGAAIFLLKLFLGWTASPAAVLGQLRAYRALLERRLAEFEQLESGLGRGRAAPLADRPATLDHPSSRHAPMGRRERGDATCLSLSRRCGADAPTDGQVRASLDSTAPDERPITDAARAASSPRRVRAAPARSPAAPTRQDRRRGRRARLPHRHAGRKGAWRAAGRGRSQG